jgi:hypothetical protein
MRAEGNPVTRVPNATYGEPSENRFADLAGEGWKELPSPVRRRFSLHLGEGERVIYLGEVAHTYMSRTGWLVAQVARMVGAPLPLERSERVSVSVLVAGCERLGGQLWTRIYERANGFPQVIQSVKRFGGSTGLEEMVGRGVGMRLRLSVRERALVFRSAGYFLRCFGIEFSLPLWMTPGVIEVVHREESRGRFSFTLSVDHAWAGHIIEQVAFFEGDSHDH